MCRPTGQTGSESVLKWRGQCLYVLQLWERERAWRGEQVLVDCVESLEKLRPNVVQDRVGPKEKWKWWLSSPWKRRDWIGREGGREGGKEGGKEGERERDYSLLEEGDKDISVLSGKVKARGQKGQSKKRTFHCSHRLKILLFTLIQKKKTTLKKLVYM